MAFIDYYSLLGISKTASDDDVKKAYRKLARQYHPDLNPDNNEAKQKFQQINEANEVLSDPDKRKKYDTYGEHWQHGEEHQRAQEQQQQRGSQGNRQDAYSGNFDEGQFSDFFGSVFGNRAGGGRQSKYRGQDYDAEVSVTLREAFTTHQHTFNVNGNSVRITVPAGIANGQKIKLKERGAPGVNGGPAGDLYITFTIADDPIFKRVGNDLYVNAEVNLYAAILGGETMVDAFDGKVKLKVKPGTQVGTKMRLKGKGFPMYKKDGEFGDLIVTLNVKLPTELTEKQKELFKQLSEL